MLTGEDFFEHKFVTKKNPDDIVDFYSTEDFLQILGVFPIAISFVLAGVEWDTERENTMSVHNAMEISFTLEEREEETADGEKVVAFFQKRERFKNYVPFTKFLMWDQVQCYGYNRREDGTCEVFHRGEVGGGRAMRSAPGRPRRCCPHSHGPSIGPSLVRRTFTDRCRCACSCGFTATT